MLIIKLEGDIYNIYLCVTISSGHIMYNAYTMTFIRMLLQGKVVVAVLQYIE